MRQRLFAAIYLPAFAILSAAPVHADDPVRFPHVRSEHGWILQLLDDGRNRSATLRGLLDHIEQSDGIVHIVLGTCPMPGMKACLPNWMGNSKTMRFLRIRLDPDVRHDDATIALLAHELRHAAEVLDDKSVTSGHAMVQLFKRIGLPSGSRSFETGAAEQAGFIVARELLATAVTTRDDEENRR
jgi:hypothetical protein